MVKITEEQWYWPHNISECYYHIQLTIKYRRSLFQEELEKYILRILKGLKERYMIKVNMVGFNRNHIHILCRFLPRYSVGKVIRLIKSISSQLIF